MASRYEDDELNAARSSLQSLSQKSESLRSSGGNLDRNGEPSLTARRGESSFTPGGRDESAAARSSMRGHEGMVMSPSLGIPSRDGHITGSVGGRQPRKIRKQSWSEENDNSKPQEAMLRPTKLNLPVVRPMRPANEDGATSFHFSHEAISKTRLENTTARGTKNRKGAAQDHARYIEREEAVAKDQQAEAAKIADELTELAKTDPDLARQLGIKPEGEEKDAAEALEGASQREGEALGAGGQATAYIEREEALAHDPNGVAVLFSNISEDPAERREFWQLVERAESDPSADRMQLRMKGNEEFWSKVAADKDCPKKLRLAIEAADPNEIISIQTRDNQAVRDVMKRHGWKPRERRPRDETDEQRAAREEREAAAGFGARFEDGRGGRVQFRIVGELPHEVPHAARVRILKDFAAEFEARGLPYIAVMHAPDHTNDDRNWHFHLVYHDRPAKRFTCEAVDHLQNLAKANSAQAEQKLKVATAALADPAIKKQVGQWDFAIQYTYTRSNRHTSTVAPFAQPKDREVTRRPFVPMLRRRLSLLTNRELEAAGAARRVDPRRYDEMGIHKESDEHLGTQASLLESVGVPTEQGLRNELNQWEFMQRRLEAQARADQARIDKQIDKWNAGIRTAALTDAERKRVDEQMAQYEKSERIAAEHRAIAKNIEEHIARLRSRAEKVSKMADKHLAAIGHGQATKRQKANKARYQAKLDEAQIHLAGIDVLMLSEIKQASNSYAAAQRHGNIADAAKLIVETTIAQGRSQRLETERTSAPVPANESQRTPAAIPANKDQRTPAAASDTGKRTDAAQPNAGALGKSQIDRYIDDIVRNNRRLMETGTGFIPRDLTAADRAIIYAPNFGLTQSRLSKVKRFQDGKIADLVAAIKRNPGMVKHIEGAPLDRDETKVAERVKITTSDKTLQATFRNFSEVPEIRIQIEIIEDARRDAELLKAAAAARAGAKPEPAEAATDTPRPKERAKAPANDNDRIIEIMRSSHIRPKIESLDAGMKLTFSREDRALFQLPEAVLITDKRSASRIEGISRTNERSMKRILAYIQKNPAKVEAGGEGGALQLVSTAPAELAEIAANFKRDEELARAMQNAIVKARIEAAAPAKTELAEKAKSAEKGQDVATSKAEERDPDDYGLFKIVDGVPVMAQPKREKKDFSKHTYEPSGYGYTRPDMEKYTKKGPDRASIRIDPSRIPNPASESEVRKEQKLRPGIDPLFDKWHEALRTSDHDERRRLSGKIRQDERLRELAQSFEPGYVAQFKADWEAIEARGSGTTRDRGRGR